MASDASSEKKPRRLMRWLLWGPPLLCLFICAGTLTWLMRPNSGLGTKASPQSIITVSADTTGIVKPLTDRGYVDYQGAVNERAAEGVTPEENAAVVFVQLMNLNDISKGTRSEYFAGLGIPEPETQVSPIVNINSLIDLDEPGNSPALENQKEAMAAPWTKAEFPVVANWLEKNEIAISLAVEASEKPRYYAPLLTGDGGDEQMMIAILLPDLQNVRTVCRMLAARSMLSLAEERYADAWSDILVIHRLGKLINQHEFVIGQLVSIAITTIGCETVDQYCLHAPMTRDEARDKRKELAPFEARISIVERVDKAERFAYLDSVSYVARNGLGAIEELGGSGDETGRTLLNLISTNSIDWDVVLKNGNRWFDQSVEAMRIEEDVKRIERFHELDEQIKDMFRRTRNPHTFMHSAFSRSQRSQLISDIMLSLMLPALSQVVEAEARMKVRFELQRLGFAIVEFQAENGRLPGELSELVPEFLDRVPVDHYAGEEFRFLTADADYIAYSIGPNRIDDGGATRRSMGRADDISIGDMNVVPQSSE